MDQRLVLITLLVKLGVSAAVSSVLARARRFRVLLFNENRPLSENLEMVALIAVPYALGVIVRHSVKNFLAADLAFEASLLMGVITGRVGGMTGALFVSLPQVALGDWTNLPLNVGAGLAAGWMRRLATDREAIWSFSPLFDLSIYRWIRRTIAKSFIDWQTSFFVLILCLEFLLLQAKREFPHHTFALLPQNWAVMVAIYLGTVMTVAIALKVLNNTRIEMKLEEQQRLLLQARMDALQSQINPHFLFNTLNSVSSLVRFDPDTARIMIVKLSNILRRLLGRGDNFVRLRDEFSFIDDYLDIEVVRFGRDKLKVVKEEEPESLDAIIPSMILQPLVENSIKHGISPKVDGGSIYLRSRIVDGRLVIEVEDDGVGLAAAGDGGGTGIGLANVKERLKVLYGDAAWMELESREGNGTVVRLVLPMPTAEDEHFPYEFRSTTAR
ncbi:MAG: histidine kinase [Terriglobia bacterium]|jgi:two-component system LytT family sensor kinase|nr:histidine kinase [Terriglobia bacterium]